VYAVNPIPVKSSSVAADRAFIGSAPHHASTAATARTPVTTHRVTVCTVPTASAEPAIAAASTHRLARVIGLEPALPWLPVVVIARLGEYLRLSVAADLADVRNRRGTGGSFPAHPRVGCLSLGHPAACPRHPTRRPTTRICTPLLDLGLDEADACRLLRGLHSTDSSGRLRSEQTDEWLYVFMHRVASEAIYVKLVLRSDCVIVSFHEQVDDEDP
jgi:hypothetical protein